MNKLQLLRGFFQKSVQRHKVRLNALTPVSFSTTEEYLPTILVKGNSDTVYNEYWKTVIRNTGYYDKGRGEYLLPYRFTGRNLIGKEELDTLAYQALDGYFDSEIDLTANGFSMKPDGSDLVRWLTADRFGFKENTSYTVRFQIKTPKSQRSGFNPGVVALYDDGTSLVMRCTKTCDGKKPVEVRYVTPSDSTLSAICLTQPATGSIEIYTTGFCLYEGTGDLPDGFTGTYGEIVLDAPLQNIPGSVSDTLDFVSGVLTRNVGTLKLDAMTPWEVYDETVNPPIFRIPAENCGEGEIFSDGVIPVRGLAEMAGNTYCCTAADGYIYLRPDSDYEYFEDLSEWMDCFPMTLLYPLEVPAVTHIPVPAVRAQVGNNVLSIGGPPTEVLLEYYT
ncbi:MAG: hypothetical protein MJ082_05220 [Clostridia bacterium]|nr:hypothetical protein [Clostridia bacterium]